jgi:hypothetical protein
LSHSLPPDDILENDNLIGGQGPLAQQIHTAQENILQQILRLEPASLATAPSESDLAPPGQRFQHSLDIVEAIGCLLPLFGAPDAIAGQKDSYSRFWSLDQIQGQA